MTVRTISVLRLVCILAVTTGSGCLESTGGSGGAGGGGLVDGGDACHDEGSEADASDGCNTCVCDAATWVCTRAACPGGGSCTDGEQRPSADGCNDCTCLDGQWACTQQECVPPPNGSGGTDTPGTGGMGTGGMGTGGMGSGGIGSGGTGGSVCIAGDTRLHDDGCNTCTCVDGTGWSCTLVGCAPNPGGRCGGFAGNTCGASEYCAYEEGQSCGAADEESVCMTRPQICNAIYAPVCGCDGNTYGSACNANGSGTGILHDGEC